MLINPHIAINNHNQVVEVHQVHSLGGLISRTGILSLSNAEEIEWADPAKINENRDIAYPAVLRS
jgi:hypothetical protein